MSMTVLIAIEGIDGSGKGTQAQQLVERLNQHAITACLLSFPRYSETLFGTTIGRFLDGDFGPLDAVAPELAATLYAGDRYESRGLLIDALDNQQVVVCDRYVPSNLAHQGSRVDRGRQNDLIEWIERIEYDVFKLPRPDAVVWLDVPPHISQELIRKKTPRDYTDKTVDLQEADLDYQQRVYQLYQSLANTRPHWTRIDGLEPGSQQVRPIPQITEDVWNTVSKLL